MNRSKVLALLLVCIVGYVVLNPALLKQVTQVLASTSRATSSLSMSVAPNPVARGSYDVVGKPTITVAYINKVLCNAHSPACGTGDALYAYGVQADIDPAYALAFFKHESSYGLHGIAVANLGLGNIRCTSGYTCLHGFRCYTSWQAGYKDWYTLIYWYAHTLNKRTIPDIIPTYAPSSENDTQGYIVKVEQAVDAYREGI